MLVPIRDVPGDIDTDQNKLLHTYSTKNLFQFLFISAHNDIQCYLVSRHNWCLPTLHGVYGWLYPYSNREILTRNLNVIYYRNV